MLFLVTMVRNDAKLIYTNANYAKVQLYSEYTFFYKKKILLEPQFF